MTASADSTHHVPRKARRKKKLTRADMRKLVDQLLKFFKEHPEYEMPLVPESEDASEQDAA